MTIRTATTITEFNDHVASSIDGDVVEIAPGLDLLTRSINGKSLTGVGMTITSADLNNHGRFKQLTLSNCAGIHLEEVTLKGAWLVSDGDWIKGVHIVNSDDCSIHKCNIIGDTRLWQNPEAAALPDEQKIIGWGHAVNVETSSNITITNNYFKDWKRGFVIIGRVSSDCTGIIGSMNMMENVDGDRFFIAATDGATFDDNYMINSRSNQTLPSSDHVDGFQIHAAGTGANALGGTKNLNIRRNIVDCGNGAMSQIIFARHEALETGEYADLNKRHQNFVISDNLGISRTTHGVSLASVLNADVNRNAVFRAPYVNPDVFLNNDLTLNGVTVPDILTNQGVSPGGVYNIADNFSGALTSPAAATLLNNLQEDPSLTPFDEIYSALVTGWGASYDSSGAAYDNNHLNVIWPKAGGALVSSGIGPTWWLNDTWPGWGPYNTGAQPSKPTDQAYWGRVALNGGGAGTPHTLPGSLLTINVQVG